MRNRIMALKYFYREYTVYNLLFTSLGAYLLMIYGAAGYSYIIWLKIVGYGVTALGYYFSRKKHLYFFYNLGFGLKYLLTSAFLIDLLITFMILISIRQMFY